MTYIQGLLDYCFSGKQKRVDYVFQDDRFRYFLKIQDGCEHFCSCCIIPYIRGKIQNRKEEDILKEARGAGYVGYKEIILSGIHLGLYGKDSNTNLVELLKKIIHISELGRIRLSSIEINEVSDELIKIISQSSKICNHLHIPLQSGSNKILKAMNRSYTADYFQKRVGEIRSIIPDIAVSTDIMVGFPGEDINAFLETYNLIKKLNFSRLHVFPFSGHEKTPAYKMPDQIDSGVAKQRTAKIINLGKNWKADLRKKLIKKE